MNELINKNYKLIAFDWDGTAIYDRNSNVDELLSVISRLLDKNINISIITGTNVSNIHNQFLVHLQSNNKQNLYICTNRGSEVFSYQDNKLTNIYEIKATKNENKLLDNIAIKTKSQIESISKADIQIIFNRVNRRKIDLNPNWMNPPKEKIKELTTDTIHYLTKNGLPGGIKKIYENIATLARSYNFNNAKITTDGKFLEIGLTDKGDSISWLLENLAVNEEEILVLGDEFGKIDGISGSDYNMVLRNHSKVTYISVGVEPFGVPEGIIHQKGGEKQFLKILNKLAK